MLGIIKSIFEQKQKTRQVFAAAKAEEVRLESLELEIHENHRRAVAEIEASTEAARVAHLERMAQLEKEARDTEELTKKKNALLDKLESGDLCFDELMHAMKKLK